MTRWGSLRGFWAEEWSEGTLLAAGWQIDYRGQAWSWANKPGTLPPGSPEDTLLLSKQGTWVARRATLSDFRSGKGEEKGVGIFS